MKAGHGLPATKGLKRIGNFGIRQLLAFLCIGKTLGCRIVWRPLGGRPIQAHSTREMHEQV